MPIYDREALIRGTFKTVETVEEVRAPVQSKFGGVLRDPRSADEAHRALLARAQVLGAPPYDPHTKVGKDFQRAALPPDIRAFGTRDLHSETGAYYAQEALIEKKNPSWMQPSTRK